MLKKHKNRNFAKIFIDIFIFDVKIGYIDSNQLILIENYLFVFNAFDIFIKNLDKQLKIDRIIRVQCKLQSYFIFLSLNLVSKTNNN